jgi:hypothetical protein
LEKLKFQSGQPTLSYHVGGLAFFDILITYLLLLHAEYDAEVSLVVAGAADAEVSYLASTLYVGTEARTHVVVAHID